APARPPGRMTRHYAPNAPLRLGADGPRAGEAFLAFGPAPDAPVVLNLSPNGELAETAGNLAAHLRGRDPARHRRRRHSRRRTWRGDQRPAQTRRGVHRLKGGGSQA